MDNRNAFTNVVYRSYISTHLGGMNRDILRSYQSRFYMWRSYFLHMLPKNPKSRILEIGCGMGHNLYALRKLGCRNVTGFDISKECVALCRGKGFSVVWARDVRALSRQNHCRKSFDFIIVYDLLEHFFPNEALAFLRSLRSLSAAKGSVFISFPNGEFPLNMPQRYIDISHAFLYTSASLSQLFRLAKMEPIHFGSVPSFSLDDDNLIMLLIKRCVMRPCSELSIFVLRLYLASLGVKLIHPKPQLFSLARFV